MPRTVTSLRGTESLVGRTGLPSTRTASECECPPACPACGGLECLCRPRFFAGQVLSEDDLNRLENYVVAKNRLYNRHFHGPGVVCGLEVVCDTCDSDSVTVKPGYAIAPCGDDIIVCQDTKAPICDLIQRCSPQDDCDPYGQPRPAECDEGIQKWVLSICYDEKFSRGVQPLKSEPCACKSGGQCSCGGNCSGGGSGSGGGPRTAAVAKPTGRGTSRYNPQCEPTLICETYRFKATRYVDVQRRTGGDLAQYGVWGQMAAKSRQFGPLLSRLIVCYLKAVEIRDAFAGLEYDTSASSLAAQYSEYLALLREFSEEHLAHRCDILRTLRQIQPAEVIGGRESVTRLQSAALWKASFEQLNSLWLEVFRDCFCSALLPPCPEPESDNCVPLAVVTLDLRNRCRVVSVCNWSAREFSLTLPTIAYWTSFMNWSSLKEAIAKLCCESDSIPWAAIFQMFEKVVAQNTASQRVVPPVAREMRSRARGRQPSGAEAPETQVGSDLLGAMMGLVAGTARPDGMAQLLSVSAAPASGAPAMAELHATVQELRRTVDEQGAQIRKLSRR
ncbi:MAG: hypothetical protein OEY13_05140 [Gammaproteobacteria bacterium]|nr:hypothetical protein [Gammaproteobacteria bacterium]MDH5272443.1 hypothetical protein [Gammaproteobacteria bacterium]